MGDELRIALPVPKLEGFTNYFAALTGLGAVGVPVNGSVDPAGFDGLLLPGGGDVNPARYHRANAGSMGIDDALDALQLAALDAFVKAEKPVFGVCRGHQLINVYFGGTLIQHLPQAEAHSWDETRQDRVHGTVAGPGGVPFALYGAAFAVNSSHHQGVDAPGEGLRITQHSDDGVVEAMEHRRLPLFSVQWHPERMCFAHARGDTVDGSAVIRYFLELCQARRGK